MTPTAHTDDARVEEQEAFVAPELRGARRVLEVGCGRGLLAARLAAPGREVVAIDVDLPDELPVRAGLTFERADVRTFDADRFDAIAFTASLHHVAPLDAALDRAAALLAPGGRLIVDDFDLDAPDVPTLRWYYDAQDVLAAAGAYDAERIDGARDDDPRARWRAGHAPHDGEAPLHTGAAMIAAIGARFANVSVTRGPYLWRYIARGARGPHARVIATALLAAEVRGIAEGTWRPVGLRITATRP